LQQTTAQHSTVSGATVYFQCMDPYSFLCFLICMFITMV